MLSIIEKKPKKQASKQTNKPESIPNVDREPNHHSHNGTDGYWNIGDYPPVQYTYKFFFKSIVHVFTYMYTHKLERLHMQILTVVALNDTGNQSSFFYLYFLTSYVTCVFAFIHFYEPELL